MGTKNQPGDYDCYANAHPDEPMFVLLGRDPCAPACVGLWIKMSEARGTAAEKVAEARRCADAMRAWRQGSEPSGPMTRLAEERVHVQEARHVWARAQPEHVAAVEAYERLLSQESARVRANPPPEDDAAFMAHIEAFNRFREEMLKESSRAAGVYAVLLECYDYAYDAERMLVCGRSQVVGCEVPTDLVAVEREARRMFDRVRASACPQ